MSITTKVYVVSLPRTGTKTVCKMLSTVGYNVKHLPSVFYPRLIGEDFNAFADTPCYSYSFVYERKFDKNDNKFIYIDRPVDDWIESFEGVNLHTGYSLLMNLTMHEHMNVVRLLDSRCMGEVFGYHKTYDREHFKQKYYDHREQMQELLGDKMLVYKLSQGWEPLCEFLNLPLPESEVPHLNQKVINERIV